MLRLRGRQWVVLCIRIPNTSSVLIVPLFPFCLKGSAAMLSSSGSPASATLCHLALSPSVLSTPTEHCSVIYFRAPFLFRLHTDVRGHVHTPPGGGAASQGAKKLISFACSRTLRHRRRGSQGSNISITWRPSFFPSHAASSPHQLRCSQLGNIVIEESRTRL